MTDKRIYFLQNGPHIKIGHSKNVMARIGNLATATAGECTLIGAAPGDRKVERALHRLLSAHRIKGEWFSDCSEVRAAMIRLQAEGDGFLFAPIEAPVEAPVIEAMPAPDEPEEDDRFSDIENVEDMLARLGRIHTLLERRAIMKGGYA